MASVLKKIRQYQQDADSSLLELKIGALKENPFRFYRGTCHLFAEDFGKLCKYKPRVKSWICGDLHFENFGSYKGENRLVYFDLNDFDEGLLAGPEPEVARFLTSIVIAARQMKVAAIGLHKTLHDILAAYTDTLVRGKALMMEQGVAHGEFKKYFERLNTLDRAMLIDKHTHKKKGALLLNIDDTHLRRLSDEQKAKIYAGLSRLLNNGRFEHLIYEDAAFRVAGTGSLGVQRYCVLCFSKKKGKHYLIDVKEARNSCYSGLLKIKQPTFKNEAERINAIGYMMQFNSPAFLSTVKMDDKWYRVRELQRSEDRMSIADFGNDFGLVSEVAVEMAVLMAYAHIRSSGHLGASTADDLAKFAPKKQWQRDMVELSGELARRNNKYYCELMNGE